MNILKNLISTFKINYYSFSILRTIIASQLFLTLVFNDIDVLYIEEFITIFNDFKISVIVFKVISILILVMTMFGLYPRFMGFLHFLVTYVFYKTCLFIDGGDQLSTNLTFIIFPLTLFDKNFNHWNNKYGEFEGNYSKPFCFFVFWLISIQISVLYLNSSIGKLSVNEWFNGTALWYWVNHESFGASFFVLKFLKWMLSFPFVIFLLNYLVIILELLISMMLFVPKKHKLVRYICFMGILFHIGVIIVHGIFSFSIVMIGSLIFYFQININLKWNSKYVLD